MQVPVGPLDLIGLSREKVYNYIVMVAAATGLRRRRQTYTVALSIGAKLVQNGALYVRI